MKNTLFLFLMVVAGVSVSCNKVKPKDVDKAITKGTWYVSYFSEDGNNETNDFSGYIFTFSDNGNVSATYNGGTTIGSWSTSNSSDDDSNSKTDFNLNFPTTSILDELSDDWHVINLSDNTLELEDVSGGNGGVDKLTFTKN